MITLLYTTRLSNQNVVVIAILLGVLLLSCSSQNDHRENTNVVDAFSLVQKREYCRISRSCSYIPPRTLIRQDLSLSSSGFSLNGETIQTNDLTTTGTNLVSSSYLSADNDDHNNNASISVASATFGLVKAMVGSGLLALSSGLAAVTNYRNGLYPAHAFMIVLGLISAYTFSLYGRLIHITKARTLGELWKKVHATSSTSTTKDTFKKPSGFAVSLVSFVFCFGSCIAYSLTIGDMFSSCIRGLSLSIPAWVVSRQATILAISSTMVYPLCQLSSLTALAPASILGVIGIIITTAFMAFRCPAVVANSPYSTIGAGMLTNVVQQPSFETYSKIFTPAPLILIAMACVSFMAHFSAPDFYHSLSPSGSTVTSQNSTISTQHDDGNDTTMQRYNQMTVAGYISVAILNALALSFGFLTFGGSSNGIILNNYSNADWGAMVSRSLVGLSVIGSYPFLMKACRGAAFELFTKTQKTGVVATQQESMDRRMTTILLSIITAISLLVKDVGFVISFNGALMGSTIAFTFPALLFLKIKAQQNKAIAATNGKALRAEMLLCKGIVGFGVLSAIVGGATSVISYFFPYLLR